MKISGDAVNLTINILKDCKKAGYHIVTIGRPDPDSPACKKFPANWGDSIFAWSPDTNDYNNKCSINRWPAVWEIAKRYCGMSCGNSHQAQLPYPKPDLYEGTFNLAECKTANQVEQMVLKKIFTEGL